MIVCAIPASKNTVLGVKINSKLNLFLKMYY